MTDTAPTSPPEPETEMQEAATKAAVFCAAERLFALHGFQNVSVRDITAEAGVNLASVNYHFGSKDGLLFEIFRQCVVAFEPAHINGQILDLARRFFKVPRIVAHRLFTEFQRGNSAEPSEVLDHRVIVETVTVLDVQKLETCLAVRINVASGRPQCRTNTTR